MLPDTAAKIKKKKKKKRKRRAAAAEDTLAVEDRPLLKPAPAVTSPPLPVGVPPTAAPAALPSAKGPPAPAATCLEFHAEIVAWLAKRKLELPAATSGLAARHESIAAYAVALCEGLGGPQPGLRERERRALVRFATQRAAAAAAPPPSERHSSSSEEDEDGLAEAAAVVGGLPVVEGGAWPAGLEFSSEYRWGASVPEELRLRCPRLSRGLLTLPPFGPPPLHWPPPTHPRNRAHIRPPPPPRPPPHPRSRAARRLLGRQVHPSRAAAAHCSPVAPRAPQTDSRPEPPLLRPGGGAVRAVRLEAARSRGVGARLHRRGERGRLRGPRL